MVITVLRIELTIFESASLKDKRAVVRRVLDRVRNKFPVAASEVGRQDDPAHATLAFAALSSDGRISHATIQKTLAFIEDLHIDAEISDVETESIHL